MIPTVLLISVFFSFGQSGDPLSEERTQLVEIRKLAESIELDSRIQAAEMLTGLHSQIAPAELVLRLIRDPNLEVRIAAYSALNSVCSATSFTKEEAAAFATPLRNIVTRDNIDRLLTKQAKLDDGRLLLAQAGALNSLFVWYPLVSYIEFEIWQKEIYSYSISVVANRASFNQELHHSMLILFGGLHVPQAIQYALGNLVEGLTKMPADEMRNSILILWKHPVLGNGRPMTSQLKLALLPHILEIKEKLGVDIKMQDEIDEVLKVLETLRK